ncbi:MAG: alpha/beta hydrolase [Dermatophilus congolensis]|nr:alpha/beta hydrolase [Dermatophilus congolensis]
MGIGRRGARIAKWLGLSVAVVVVLGGGYLGAKVWDNVTYFDRGIAKVWDSGFVVKQADIDGATVNYAEGPANGPALLLIHGQSVDWQNYFRVLPELSKRYHVFAVDCYGHGSSARVTEKYSAVAHGRDLQRFITDVVGEPVIVSGHSSGGQLATWLAANAPEQVLAALLEDPPLFTTTLPRAKTTWNYVDLATSAHTFLASGQTDFVAYTIEHSRMWQFFGDSAEWFKQQARDYHRDHPGQGVKWWTMPPLMNESFRALGQYDPHFGDAFYTGTWDEGWDHAETLARISVPTPLVHTKVEVGPDGILRGAMSNEEADRAFALLQNGTFHRSDTGHGFHDEAPDEYIKLLDDLRLRALGPTS